MFAIIGMSPGNGYFKLGVITQILKKAVEEYENIGIFIPDIPAISTYIALGYPEIRARRDKAIPQGNALKNKVLQTIESLDIHRSKIKIFDWTKENIENNSEYREKFNYIRNLYNLNIEFKKDADTATAQVLQGNNFRKIPMSQKQIEIGVHYLLSELSFILFLPEYINQEKVGYVYHKPWPVFENLIAGNYDHLVKKNIEFISFPEFS